MRPTRGLGRTIKGLAGAFLTPAEDPRATHTDEAGQQQALIERVRQARGRVTIAQQRLERRLELGEAGLESLIEQARQSLIAGREDLARLALQRRRAAEAEQRALAGQSKAIASEGDRLALVEQHLTARLEAWTARREILAARLTAAEAQAGIEETLTGAAHDLAGFDAAISQTEDTLQYLQARATAIDQLTEIGVLDSLDGLTLSAHDQAIEAELESLRASVAVNTAGVCLSS